jgi:transposase InsO family protein
MYGYRRIKKALLKQTNCIVNHKKILRIMNKYNLKVKYKDIFKINWVKKCVEANVKPNLIKRNFNAINLNQKWSTDITYIIYKGKRAYL